MISPACLTSAIRRDSLVPGRASVVVEPRHKVAGRGEHQALASGDLLVAPGGEHVAQAGVGITGVDAVVIQVVPKRGPISLPQIQ